MTHWELVDGVVRIVGTSFNTGTVFETPDDVAAVCIATELGLLRLVPVEHNPFRMHDSSSGTTWGVELTFLGMRQLGIDPGSYYKSHGEP